MEIHAPKSPLALLPSILSWHIMRGHPIRIKHTPKVLFPEYHLLSEASLDRL